MTTVLPPDDADAIREAATKRERTRRKGPRRACPSHGWGTSVVRDGVHLCARCGAPAMDDLAYAQWRAARRGVRN